MNESLSFNRLASQCARALWYEFHAWMEYVPTPDKSRVSLINKAVRAAVRVGEPVDVSAVFGHVRGRAYVDGTQVHVVDVLSRKDFSARKKELMNSREEHNLLAFYAGVTNLRCTAVSRDTGELVTSEYAVDKRRAVAFEEHFLSMLADALPPAKISDYADFWLCKMCSARDVCHRDETPLVNCRSCDKATPTNNGGWVCGGQQQLTWADQKAACDEYV